MSMSEDQTVQSIRRKNRRIRKESSQDLCIEELLPDDMAYDADIEVIHPDKYEDAESDFEQMIAPAKSYQNVDDELADCMRRLGRDRSHSNPYAWPGTERGRKRRSTEMEEGSRLFGRYTPELEVQEMNDGPDQPSPAKRRRKRPQNLSATQHILHSQVDGSVESSGKVQDHTQPTHESTASASASDMQTAAEPPSQTDEAMDMM